MDKIHNETTENLFKAILSLESIEECYNFFDDLCTIKEIKEMAQRFDVAKLLSEGKIYTDVAKETGASSATISRVNRCLTYGSDGYTTVLARIKDIL
ncbi:MAG: YerC/YecD family TrpR-related protein [Bacillota bacterium]|nr:YerC/YecD family TrpR-related protein [Bacillota bacterium]